NGDFLPTAKAGAATHALLVHPDVPAKSVKELVDLIKTNPGKYTIASPGLGTTPSLSIELFKQTFKLDDLVVVPFQGGAPAIQSVVAGHTPLSFQAIPPAAELVRDGKLRALAVTATKRSSTLPDVPTLHELGIEGRRPRPCRACWCRPAPRRRSSTGSSARSGRSSPSPTCRKGCCRSASSPRASRRPPSRPTSNPRSPSGSR